MQTTLGYIIMKLLKTSEKKNVLKANQKEEKKKKSHIKYIVRNSASNKARQNGYAYNLKFIKYTLTNII